MEFKLVIDPGRPEEVAATVHARSELTDRIEALVLRYSGADKLTVYARDEVRQLPFSQIECLTVIDGKTWAIDGTGTKYPGQREAAGTVCRLLQRGGGRGVPMRLAGVCVPPLLRAD